MPSLAEMSCVPCRAGTPALTRAQIAPLLEQLDSWTVIDDHHLHRRFVVRDFRRGLDLVNLIATMADEQDHHPDLGLAWGRVDVTIWTHTIDGLAEGDFVFAAKCDAIFREMEK